MVHRTLWLTRLAALGVLLLAVMVLADWALDNPLLKLAPPGQVTMKPNAAVGFALAALALRLLAGRAGPPWRQRIALGFALVVGVLGAVTLTEYLLGTNLGIDQLLFHEPAGAFGTSHPGRMAPQAAVCFMLLGATLWLLAQSRAALVAQLLAVLVALIGLLDLIGYIYGAKEFYQFGSYTQMAMPTAAAFLVMGVGALCARPDVGLMNAFSTDSPGGVIIRRLLMMAIILPVALDWFLLHIEQGGLIEHSFGDALGAVTGSFVMVALVWWTAQVLEQGVRERLQAELESRTILKTAIDGFWVVDAEGRLLEVNEAYCGMSGYSRGELLRMRIPDLDASDTSDEVGRRIEKILAMGSDRFERRHRRKDGSLFDVDISVQYLKLRGGVFVVFLQDITQRKQAEESLREANAQLDQRVRERTAQLEAASQVMGRQSRLMEQSQAAAKVGGWELDLVTRELFWTEETYRIHELTPTDYTPTLETAINFYAPESRPTISAAVEAGMAEGRDWDLELELITATQRRIWVRAVGKVQFTDGRPVKVYGAFQDITERKQAEEHLRLQASALESAANAIHITDRHGNIQWVNPAFTQLTGYSSQEAVGRNPRELVKSGRHDAAFFKNLWDTILDGRVWQGEIINRRKDGTLYAEFQTITPVRDHRGQVSHFVAIKKDITERKRAEEDLRIKESAMASAISGIAMAGLDEKITYVNAAWLRMFGYDSPAEVIGTTPMDHVQKPADAVAAVAGIKSGGHWAGEMVCRRRDGVPFFVELECNMVTGDDGRPLSLLAAFEDITERKRAEETLRESEDRYRSLVEESPDVIGIYQEGKLVFINSTGVEQLGAKSKDELLGLSGEQLIHPDDHSVATDRIRRRLAGETGIYPAEVRYRRLDGTMLFMEIIATPITFGGKEAVQFIARDITGRKRAEQELTMAHRHATVLAQLGRKLAEVLTPRAAALSILQAADGLLHWDSSWLRVWSEEQQQWKDLAAFDLMDGGRCELITDPSSMLKPSPIIHRAMEEAQLLLRSSETQVLTVLGSGRRSLSLMFAPIRLTGRTIGMISIQSYQHHAYDRAALELLQTLADHCAGALARIQAASELNETQERFRLIWENSVDGMRLTDSAGNVLMVNEAFCRLVEKPRSEIEGKLMCEIYAEEDREHILARHRERFISRTVPAHLDQRLKLWDGREIWLEVSNCFFEPEPSKPVLLGLFRDITERKRAENQTLRTQRLESIGTLAGGVAHDLNNALAPVMMATELLRLEFPETATRYIELIQAGAKRGSDMVKQLLTFAKGAEGKSLLLQPRHLVKEIDKLMRSTFPKSIELRIRYAGDIRPIMGDATQLHQVLLNLCVNARDAMPAGGTLTLKVENVEIDSVYANAIPEAKPGQYVRLQVMDTGIGISPEIEDRIFEPFFTTKGPERGTGLGLSTVIGIVKGHGGFIRVYSIPGQGSTFAVYLPAAASGTSDTSVLAKLDTTFRGNGETILVVDDEPAVRDISRVVLTKLNFKVLTATNGTEALIRVSENRADLRAVITDLHMPHMDGLTFVRVLKSELPQASIIVASGRLDECEESEFKALGVNVLLDKPFTQEKLVEALKTVFQKQVPTAPAT